MTPDFQQKLEKVLTELGLYIDCPRTSATKDQFGWRCVDCGTYDAKDISKIKHGRRGVSPRYVPPLTPELAWRCVEAAYKRGFTAHIWAHALAGSIDIFDQATCQRRATADVKGNLAEALITAIAAALEPTRGGK